MADSASPTAAEIVAAIRSKQMTAVSAVQAAIARAEQMKDLNAFIILNKDGALAAAAQVDKGEKTGRACGLADRRQGQHQHRRHADVGRHAGAAECPADEECALAAEIARCRRDRHRQDQHA